MCVTIVVLLGALIGWVSYALFSGPDASDMNAFHPFRSAEAKAEYLDFYNQRAQLWPVISEERMASTSYGETFVRISGPVDAPPLVLLPGGGATSLLWRYNIKSLSGKYRTYAVDNIYDFGRSVFTRPIENPEDFVAWLDELFTALALGDSISLMGLSYGGWVTSQYALHHPERLHKVILVAPAATVLPFSGEFLWRSAASMIPLRYFTKSLMYWIAEDLVKTEAGRKIADDRVDDVRLAFRCFKFKMLVNPTVLTDEQLQGFTVPTLFLVGEHEKIYSAPAAVQRLQTIAPHIRVEVIPGVGHDLTFLKAEMVNGKILEFLQHP